MRPCGGEVLGVDRRVHRRRIAVPGDGRMVDQRVEPRHRRGVEDHVARRPILLEVGNAGACRGSSPAPGRAPAATRDRAAPGCAQARRRRRQTRRAAPDYGRGAARGSAASSGECRRRSAPAGSGTPPARKPRPTGEKATKVVPSSWHAASTPSSGLRVHSEYSVCNAAIGCDRGGAAQRRGADFGQADRADLARLNRIGERADRLLDRRLRVEPVEVVEVDVVEPSRGRLSSSTAVTPARLPSRTRGALIPPRRGGCRTSTPG